MKIRHAVSFVAFGLILAYGAYYIASLGVRIGPPDDRVNVSMQVQDTNSLVVDSNVLLRGAPVGKITKIQPAVDRGSAIIDFYVDKKYPIPADSEVRLENLSALGESYIALMPRTASGPMLQDGQQIATEDIKAPTSISELTTNFVRVLNQVDPGRVSSLIDELDRALPNPEEVLPNLARASMLLRNTATSMDGRGAEMLANFQTLLQNAGWVGPTIATMSGTLEQTVQPIYDMMEVGVIFLGELGAPEAIHLIGNLLDRFQGFLDTRGPDLKVIAEALMPNVQGVAAALMNFDTGQILSNLLDAVPEDGVITLRLKLQNP
jgi:phospholipid/cholesterol/gamma-HCH transport system substrate-binding protein